MEAGVRLLSAPVLLLSLLLSPLRGQTQEGPAKWLEEFEKKFPPTKKNATAEELERLSLALGIGAPTDDRDTAHPAKEDSDAYRQAGFGAWLDAQVKSSDDSIGAAPPRLRAFLESHQPALARVVALLGREVPEWGFDPRGKPTMGSANLLLANAVNRVVLCAALVAESSGRHDEAAEFLEASWSLYRSLLGSPQTISYIISIAVAKPQIGVLRKMTEPPIPWQERMADDVPWRQFLVTLESERLLVHLADEGSTPSSFFSIWTSGWRDVASKLRELSACQASKLSEEEFWKPMRERFREMNDPEVDSETAAQVFQDVSASDSLQMLRRTARLLVDRELTAKILELRQERAALRRGRWPEKFFDVDSRVCPGAAYEYQPRGTSMSIRFKGSIEEPAAQALVLPLSFEARAPRPTPTPTPARTPKAASSRAPRS
jgi:hypothetical protein